MLNKIFELLTYFIIYSILGWIMESSVRTIAERKVINTGFLKGPMCPIYGIGSIIIILFLSKLENNLILLFLSSIVVLSIWEYLVGVLLEKMFHTKYWDYSDHKFNIKGRICLTNSIYWGILGIIFVKYIHPFIEKILISIDIRYRYIIITVITILFLIDMILSIIKVKNIKITLEKVEKLNNEIKEKLREIAEIEINSERYKSIENIKQLVEKLNRKKNKTTQNLYKNVYRLKKAFPAIDTNEIKEILNKRIEMLKERKEKKN